MKLRVFSLRWDADLGGMDDGEVQRFLAERSVVDVSEHFFVHEELPSLVLVVRYRDDAGPPRAPARRRGGRHDASAELDDDERRRYEALRSWRNQHARKVGRPPYVIFTNRQAAEIAQRAPSSTAELRAIEGLGESRVTELGEAIVGVVAGAGGAEPKPPADGGVPGDA